AYTFTVTNTGNVPLTGVGVDDQKVGSVTCEATELAPGEATACAADEAYVITAVDEDAGAVDNTATASALDPDGGDVTSLPDETSTRVDRADPELTFLKKVSSINDVNGNGIVDRGDELTWSFAVTNVGNVPLTSVGVADTKVGDVVCEADRLQVDEATTCRSVNVHTITDGDAAAGRVHNSAVASADSRGDSPSYSNVDTTDTLVARPGRTTPDSRTPVATTAAGGSPARTPLARTGVALGGLLTVGIGLVAGGAALIRPRRRPTQD
ncbi:MAG: hypothetical protein ACK5PP_09455, partial [Acidimicrobiales bacterium]